MLGLLVLREALTAELPAEARVPEAAPLGRGHVRPEVVDPDRAVAQARGDSAMLDLLKRYAAR